MSPLTRILYTNQSIDRSIKEKGSKSFNQPINPWLTIDFVDCTNQAINFSVPWHFKYAQSINQSIKCILDNSIDPLNIFFSFLGISLSCGLVVLWNRAVRSSHRQIPLGIGRRRRPCPDVRRRQASPLHRLRRRSSRKLAPFPGGHPPAGPDTAQKPHDAPTESPDHPTAGLFLRSQPGQCVSETGGAVWRAAPSRRTKGLFPSRATLHLRLIAWFVAFLWPIAPFLWPIGPGRVHLLGKCFEIRDISRGLFDLLRSCQYSFFCLVIVLPSPLGSARVLFAFAHVLYVYHGAVADFLYQFLSGLWGRQSIRSN